MYAPHPRLHMCYPIGYHTWLVLYVDNHRHHTPNSAFPFPYYYPIYVSVYSISLLFTVGPVYMLEVTEKNQGMHTRVLRTPTMASSKERQWRRV